MQEVIRFDFEKVLVSDLSCYSIFHFVSFVFM